MEFWAKKSKENEEYLSVNQHLKDTAFSVEYLYDNWLSSGFKNFTESEMRKFSEILPINKHSEKN